MSDLMDVKEVAKYLKVKEWTIYEWLRNGKIPALRVVGQWRFKKEVIDKWLSQGSIGNKVESEVRHLLPGREKFEYAKDISQNQRQIIKEASSGTINNIKSSKSFVERRQEERILIKGKEMLVKIIVNFPRRQEFISQVMDMSSSGLAFKLRGEKGGILPGTPLKNIVISSERYQKTIRNSSIRYCVPIEEGPNDFRVGLKFDIEPFEHSVIRRKLLGAYKIRMPRYGSGIFTSLKWRIAFVYKQKNITSVHLLNFSKFGLAFEIDKQTGFSFKKGDVLLELSLSLENKSVYDGKATIVSLEEKENILIVRCSLSEQIDLENIFSLARSKIESDEIKHFISSVEKTKEIEALFKAEIADFRLFLEKTKEKLDAEEANIIAKDTTVDKEHYREIILDRIFESVFVKFKNHFVNIWQIVRGFDEKKYNLHKRYFQNQLQHLFLLSPFNNRSYFKPLGYAGDYKMIDMIYSNPFEGRTIFAKVLNGYAIQERACQAVRNRLPYLMNKFSNFLNEKTKRILRIMSVGSGPAREIQELIKTNMDIDGFEFTLLDADKEAISYCQEKITNLLKQHNKKLKVNFINKAVDQLIKEKDLIDNLGKYDLIYSVGLFDYFTLSVCRRLTIGLYNFLNPGRKLIIGNFNHTLHENKVYMDFVLEWYLFYRSKEEMLKFTEKLEAPKRIYFEGENTGITNFLVIEK